jgi:mannosyl-3-phosphoglycerate phosphatase
VLIGFYRVAWQTRIVTIALGDGGNDVSMLRLVDRPILIPKTDGSYPTVVLEAIPNITRAKQPGPTGWNGAVLRELEKSPAKHAAAQPELGKGSARSARAS